MRMTGWLPTLRCRSDALRSAAIFRRSLTCIDLQPLPWGAQPPGTDASNLGPDRGEVKKEACFLPVRRRSDRREPVVTVLGLPRGDRPELRLQARGDLAPLPPAPGHPIDPPRRRHLHSTNK